MMAPLSRADSSSSSLYFRSHSQSEELSSETDSLGSVQYKIGRVSQAKLSHVRHEAARKRSRTLSHFSLKKQFLKKRTVSDSAILGEPPKSRFRETIDRLKGRFRSIETKEMAPRQDEFVKDEDFNLSESGKEIRRFSKEERKAFLFEEFSEIQERSSRMEEVGLPVDFDGALLIIVKKFIDLANAKQDACKLNAQLIEARKVYREDKRELKRRLKGCTTAQEKMEVQERLDQLVPVKGSWIRKRNKENIHAEQLKSLHEPRLRIYMPQDEKGICLLADFTFSVIPTSVQFTFHKEGHLKYAMDGLLVMDLQSSLQ